MLVNLITVGGGSLIDAVWGDPPRVPHPVVGLGKVIAFWDSLLNRRKFSPLALRLCGSFAVLVTLAVAFGSIHILLNYLSGYPWVFWPVNCWLMGTTIARKGLSQAGKAVYRLLSSDNSVQAKEEVGKIVGRDTNNMTKKEIVRATVESVAENTVDGVIAPLFYGAIGGAPLAMVYRAVNTLDSMLGYRNERYRYFGWAAARLDDLANLIPARICAILMVICSGLSGLNWDRSVRTVWRDAGKHPSPNGGWPEAAMAGALGVRLGGINYYQGVASFRSYLGEPLRELEIEDIKRAIEILNATTLTFLIIISVIIISQGGVIECHYWRQRLPTFRSWI